MSIPNYEVSACNNMDITCTLDISVKLYVNSKGAAYIRIGIWSLPNGPVLFVVLFCFVCFCFVFYFSFYFCLFLFCFILVEGVWGTFFFFSLVLWFLCFVCLFVIFGVFWVFFVVLREGGGGGVRVFFP